MMGCTVTVCRLAACRPRWSNSRHPAARLGAWRAADQHQPEGLACGAAATLAAAAGGSISTAAEVSSISVCCTYWLFTVSWQA